MREPLAKKFSFLFLLLLLTVLSRTVLAARETLRRNSKPCKTLVLHLHDIFQQGNYTLPNATAAPVTQTIPGFGIFNFGMMYVFDDPVTTDENINSSPAAHARGFYLYDRKDTPNTLYLISLTFNSSEYMGTLIMLGNNEHEQKTRDLAIVGGTGDFFMARGIATLKSQVVDFVKSYFRLTLNIKLYECY